MDVTYWTETTFFPSLNVSTTNMGFTLHPMKPPTFSFLRFYFLGIVLFSSMTASGQNTTAVEGFVFQLKDQNKTPDYNPLPDVSIQAYRDGKPLFPNPIRSDNCGHYLVSVEAGAPFKLVFYGDKERIPELQQLAGKVGGMDHVEVAILTIAQQRATIARSRSTQTFPSKLRCLLAELPEGSEPFKIVQEILEENP